MSPRPSRPLPPRRPFGPVELALGLAVAFGAGGCEDEESSTVDVGPLGDPHITFVEPPGLATTPTCVEVSDETDARVPMLVEVGEIVLRAPGACGSYVQCGHVALYANGELNNESAVPGIDLLLRKLADRYHDGTPLPGSGEPDLLTVRVEVQNADGSTLTDHAGEPLADEALLLTVAACP